MDTLKDLCYNLLIIDKSIVVDNMPIVIKNEIIIKRFVNDLKFDAADLDLKYVYMISDCLINRSPKLIIEKPNNYIIEINKEIKEAKYNEYS